ncbi:ABC transporter substrate-binding protein [Aquihabitans daechungensis]|uniref:ABC transporter substrate-binding protein n=1 Tax=Aquihabitans daechungensis TaxID=1052257 RepID=UPI003BA3CD81
MRQSSRPSGRRVSAAVATVLALGLVASACGGTKANDKKSDVKLSEKGLTAEAGESGLEDAGEPKRGGTIVYGVEADSSSGYCLPEAQLAISGMMVVRGIYDTLTVPNAAGDYVPYLAKSVEPNDDFTEWTITVRDNIKFHDGSDLTGEVVKNNLDAYRGAYEGRSPLLFTFVLSNIESTSAEGQNVTVKTKVPWVAFPAFLYSSSRMGIMAQSQLDDAETCDRKLVGTGPFKFEQWSPNDKLTGSRNEDYWQTAPDGEPYPYADAIEYRVLTDATVRINSLKSNGGANMIHTTNAEDIGGELYDLREAGDVNMLVSEAGAEVSFVQLNSSQPPFDDIKMRQALAFGSDRDEINQVQNDGLPTVADGPFGSDSIGYVKDPGFPEYDLEKAKGLVKEYVDGGGKAEFTVTTTSDPDTVRLAELVQQRSQKLGVKVTIVKRDQAALIDDAIGKKYQAMLFRNYPGGDPDINYVWWYGADTNPVNFGGYNDETINKLLDEGRSEPDPDKRAKIYQDINKQFAKQVWSMWSWFTPWAVVEKSNVHNILGPPLPGEDPSKPGEESTDDEAFQPNAGLATGHSLLGVWIDS